MQRAGIDFIGNFAQVSRYSSMRCLIAIASLHKVSKYSMHSRNEILFYIHWNKFMASSKLQDSATLPRPYNITDVWIPVLVPRYTGYTMSW